MGSEMCIRDRVVSELALPGAGEYFARVTGSANDVQLYQLDLEVVSVPEPATSLAFFILAGLLFGGLLRYNPRHETR